MKRPYLKNCKFLLLFLICFFMSLRQVPAEGTHFYLDINWGGIGGNNLEGPPLNYTGLSLGWKSGPLIPEEIPVTDLVSPGLLFDLGFFKMDFGDTPLIHGLGAFKLGAGLALVPNYLKYKYQSDVDMYYYVKPNFIFYDDYAVDFTVSMGLKADMTPFLKESDLPIVPSFSLGLELPAANLYGERKIKDLSLFLTVGVLYEHRSFTPKPVQPGKSFEDTWNETPLGNLKTKRLFFSNLSYAFAAQAMSYYLGAGAGWETLIMRKGDDEPNRFTPRLLTEVGYANYSVSADRETPPNLFAKTNRNGYDIIRFSAGLLWGRGIDFYFKENLLFDSKNTTNLSTTLGAELDLVSLMKKKNQFTPHLSPLLGIGIETRAISFQDNKLLFSSNEFLMFVSFRLRFGI
ncbi:hypothetical protein AGMMS49546_03100 [Spirochaetia bacterium]|nr:hypothetical protein AGMMS49546_03100 [Spirochaetia bacterium]